MNNRKTEERTDAFDMRETSVANRRNMHFRFRTCQLSSDAEETPPYRFRAEGNYYQEDYATD